MRVLILSIAVLAFSGLVVFVRRSRIESRAARREISLRAATDSLRLERELWIGFATIIVVANLLDLVFARS